MTREGLEALAAFAPMFDEFNAPNGDEVGGDQREVGPGTLTYGMMQIVDRFAQEAYRRDWLLVGFDWSEWARTDEARALFEKRDELATASADQLAKVLTVCVRQDRFMEGAMAASFGSGLIGRIVRRAASIVAEQP